MLRMIGSMVAALFIWVTPVHAQTMSYAEAASQLVNACGKDIEKYCRNVNIGKGMMNACLNKNQAKVSQNCKDTYARVFAGIEKRAKARVAVLKICDVDARRLCQGIERGDGHLLECMLTAQRGVSPKCNQAITDAGYR